MGAGVGGGAVVHAGLCRGDGLVCDAPHPQDAGPAGKHTSEPCSALCVVVHNAADKTPVEGMQ